MSVELLELDTHIRFDRFSLEVKEQLALDGTIGLFGVSGSGKSTLLRIIAGLERRAIGQVKAGPQTWLDTPRRRFIPAHQRGVGFMFQKPLLFPHLNVAANLKFADTRSRSRTKTFSFDEVVEALNLEDLLDRRTTNLSGGERQRVALGRTLLTRPRLLLLDEPLSALDGARKSDLVPYLRDVPRRWGIPTLYVSHDVDEVTALCDRVMVLREGQVAAFGDTAPVLNRLGLEPGAMPYEPSTILEAEVKAYDSHSGVTEVMVDQSVLILPFDIGQASGATVRLRVKAQDVSIALSKPEGLTIRNIIPAKIEALNPSRDTAFIHIALRLSDQALEARITRHALADLDLKAGQDVFALIKSASLFV